MMRSRGDEHATLVRYFLGELPPEERDLIEERYMIDEGYSERLDQAEADLVDAYVADTIGSEQRRHFESRYLVTPERREAVQAAFLSRAYRERLMRPDPAVRFSLRGWQVFLVPSLLAVLVIAGIAGVSWRVFRQAPSKVLVESRPPVPNTPEPRAAIGPLPAVVTVSPRPDAPTPMPPVPQSAAKDVPTRLAPEQAPAPPVIVPLPPSATLATTLPLPEITASLGEDRRPRVAIDAFDYSTVLPMAQLIFNPELEKRKKVTSIPVVPNIGAGIQAMLMQRLSEAGKVVIVEKDKLDEIKKMHMDGLSNRTQLGKGARSGRIRAPDLLLSGDIVVFGRDDNRLGFGLGNALFRLRALNAIRVISNEGDKAVVTVAYRLVDGETGEVVGTGNAEGYSIRKGKSIGGLAAANGKGGGIAQDINSTDFAQTIIGEATVDCVRNLTTAVNDQLANFHPRMRDVEGMVAAASGNTITLNVGSNDGVNVGDIFVIAKSTGDVKDPVSGNVVDRILENKGEMTVTTVKNRVAIGSYSGTPAEPKDIARRKSAAADRH